VPQGAQVVVAQRVFAAEQTLPPQQGCPAPPQVPQEPFWQMPLAEGGQFEPEPTHLPRTQQPPPLQLLPAQQGSPERPQSTPSIVAASTPALPPVPVGESAAASRPPLPPPPPLPPAPPPPVPTAASPPSPPPSAPSAFFPPLPQPAITRPATNRIHNPPTRGIVWTIRLVRIVSDRCVTVYD
jgi:hypothetical protein